nr:DUF4232 domain-containing protein [Phytoactinopolyspora alkaliphila]
MAPWGAFAPGPDVEYSPESLLEPPPIPETPAPVSDCPESGLMLSAGVADAASGLRVQDIQAVNCGSEPLELEGYPEITVLDAGWQVLDITVNHGTTSIESPEPAPVTLAPGETARVTLVWRNTVTTTESSEILEGAVVEIASAVGEPAQMVMLEYPIDLGNTGQLDVTAWSLF